MLSQSACLRCTPETINPRKLSGLPGVRHPAAAKPIRQNRLSPYAGTAEASPSEERLRIRLKAYELPLLNESVDQILKAAEKTGIDFDSGVSAASLYACSCTVYKVRLCWVAGARVAGPVPLPTRVKKYTVLRSPHVNKDSREQFEMRTHHRLLDFHDPSSQTIDALMDLALPSGVDVAVKLQ